jgi:hypothetical protein
MGNLNQQTGADSCRPALAMRRGVATAMPKLTTGNGGGATTSRQRFMNTLARNSTMGMSEVSESEYSSDIALDDGGKLGLQKPFNSHRTVPTSQTFHSHTPTVIRT